MHVTEDDVVAGARHEGAPLRQRRALRRDQRVHQVIRGSDVDAALYWLARMLEAGEDARFIARRMVIFASEDVGMADPMALLVANAAAHAVEYVGLPEAQLNLSQACIHLATAPKSNRAALGIWNAREDVRNGVGGEVPPHLRGTGYRGAATLGHGEGYDYPHDDPRGWVDQQYGPDDFGGRVYYEPSDHGFEEEVRRRMEARPRTKRRIGERRRSRHSSWRPCCASLGFTALVVALVFVLPVARASCAARSTSSRPRREPLLAEMRRSVDEARGDLDRFDKVLGSAEAISSRSRARRGWRESAFSTPVIKTVAIASGTSRAARRFRRR